jgi:hypothetical protein
MKKLTVFAVMGVFMVTFASFADAWSVTIHNNCNKDVTISVTGEHLFWTQEDCKKKVSAGTIGICQMPEAICPKIISGQYYLGSNEVSTNSVSCTGNDSLNICCCWDVRVVVKQKDASEACYIEIHKT